MLLLATLVSAGACVVQPASGPQGTVPVARNEGPAMSGANLRGTVIDAQTHAPISRAAIDIVVEGQGKYTQQTDAQGTFAMTNVPPGQYKLRVRRDGYNVWQSELVTLQPGENPPLDVALVKK
jgi:hypothetical protein